MEEANNVEEVQLYDPVNESTYTLYLSPEDARRACEDLVFAQSLLFHGSVTSNLQRENECVEKNVDENSEVQVSETSGGSWSNNETVALISAYENFCEEFEHAKKRKHVWQNIANQLLSLGIIKTAEKCEVKWRNLLRTYKAVKDNKSATGRGTTRFVYFNRLDELLGMKPSISCSHTFNSSLDISIDRGIDTSSDRSNNITEIGGVSQNNNDENGQEENNENISESSELQKPKRMKKNISTELKELKIQYLKRKEQERLVKEKRREEQMKNQKKLIDLEEKKVLLLEKLVNGNGI